MTLTDSDFSFDENSKASTSFSAATCNAPKTVRNRETTIPPRNFNRMDNGFLLVHKYNL